MNQPAPVGRTITWLLLLAAFAISMSLQTYFAPGLIMLAAAGQLLFRTQFQHQPRGFYGLLLAVPFALWYRRLDEAGSLEGPGHLLMLIGLYAVTLGLYHVYCLRQGGRPAHALFCAVFGFATAGVARENPFYVPMVVLFVPLVIVAMRQSLDLHRHAGWSVVQVQRMGLAAVATAVLAVGLHFGVVHQARTIDDYVVRLMSSSTSRSRVGFGEQASLNNVSQTWQSGQDQQVMIRYWAHQPAGYLRAMAFDRYDAGTWQSLRETYEANHLGSTGGRNLYSAADPQTDEIVGTVYLADELSEYFFLPINTHQIGSFARQVVFNPAFAMRPGRRGSAGGYDIYQSLAQQRSPGERDLEIPDELVEPISRIARSLVDAEADHTEKIARVTAYFQDGFTYQLDLTLLDDRDPVIQFLEDIRAGHCEYFAAAATLMLRSLDVPARYVTGFVVDERGATSRLWLARRKDAHAWVEAYTPTRGWVVVEPTPPDARPAAVQTTTTQQWQQWVAAQWHRVIATARYGGVIGTLSLLWQLVVEAIDRVPIPVWLALVAAGMLWITWPQWWGWLHLADRKAASQDVRRLQKQLAQAERLLRRHDLMRQPAMTVGRFLAQVRQADLPASVKKQAIGLLEHYQRHRFRPSNSVADD